MLTDKLTSGILVVPQIKYWCETAGINGAKSLPSGVWLWRKDKARPMVSDLRSL